MNALRHRPGGPSGTALRYEAAEAMARDMILPRDLEGSGTLSPLRIDDVTCVEYRSKEVVLTRMIVTTALFVVVLEGEKVLHTEKGDVYVPAGSAFFVRKGAYLFSENLGTGREYHALVFFIDDAFLADFLKAHPYLETLPPQNAGPENARPGGREPQPAETAAKNDPIFKVPLTPLLKHSAASFLPYFLHPSANKRESLRLKLEELLINLAEADRTGSFAAFLVATWSGRRQELCRLMEGCYTKPLSLSELAELSGRSLSTFKREFARLYGTTPRQWINRRRLELARTLLLGQAHNVSEACFEAGFENVSHFSRLFKQTYGHSPSALKTPET